MGLVFRVGTFAYVWVSPYDEQLAEAVEREIGYVCAPVDPYFLGYCSEEVAWSGWRDLQIAASDQLGQETVPNLLGVEAWKSVFFPFDLKPCEVGDQYDDTPLQCASLPRLIVELEQFAFTRFLPVDQPGLQATYQYYMTDELVDADEDVQTYVQVLLAARVASKQNLPLWVVK